MFLACRICLLMLMTTVPLKAALWISGQWVPFPVQLTPGVDVTPTLQVWGRFDQGGYSVELSADQATGFTTSELLHPTEPNALSYSVALTTNPLPSPA